MHLPPLFIVPSWPTLALVAGALLVGAAALVWRARRRPGRSPLRVSARAASPGSAIEEDADRLAQRRVRGGAGVYITDPQVGAEAWAGRVIDRSSRGLGLELGQPAAVGAVLAVRPADAPAACPWVQVQVRHCTRVGPRRWRLGCQFTGPQLWSTLLFFR
jgi:hypothetical protein